MKAVEKRRFTSFFLPAGWVREEGILAKGLSTGTLKVTYISPDGKKVHNKAQLIKALGHKYDLSNFDYQTGKNNHSLAKKKKMANTYRPRDSNEPMVSFRRSGIDVLKKQSCTVVRNHMKSMSKTLNHNHKSNPFQILHDKRFEPYIKRNKFKNVLSNAELEQVLKSQKSKRAQEDMYMLLAQRYNHPDLDRIGPLPTKEVIAASGKISSLKNRTSLSLLDFSEQDIKNQEALINRVRSQLTEAQKKERKRVEQQLVIEESTSGDVKVESGIPV